MPDPIAKAPVAACRTVADATCMVCGCLCDDIVLAIDDGRGRIVEAENACGLGRPWFIERPDEERPACLIDGHPASWEDGARRAAEVLIGARCPLICGLSGTTSEAQRLAVAIAEWSRGYVDAAFDRDAPAAVAFQEVGAVTCTLGEVRARGDLIIVWCCDPARTHPRHFERYSLLAHGAFVPRGRADRRCVVVDVDPGANAAAPFADEFIRVQSGRHFEALWALRALARGVELDAATVEAQTGASLSAWRGLLEQMKRARYGVLLYDEAPASPHGLSGRLDHQALFALVRELNEATRFVCVPLGRGANPVGAENVLAASTGFPAAVSFTRGQPRFSPGEHSAAALLERGEVDAVLLVSGWPGASTPLAPAGRAHLGRAPAIVLDSTGRAVSERAAVVFHTAGPGTHASGTVYRADGVPLPLRAALPSARPSDADVLRAIERHVRG